MSYKTILKTQNFINGKWVAAGNRSTEILDKYTQEVIAEIPQATQEQMDEAIVAAQKGFEVMKTWSAGDRQNALNRLADLVEENFDAFADIIVKEGGKPIGYAESEISRCLVTIRTAASEAVRFGGEVINLDFDGGAGKTAFTKRIPVGIIACITPFNFPLNLLLHKVVPALATGCSVVIKPAPQAPLSTLALADFIQQAGFPDGSYNALCCDIPEAEFLVKDERVAKLSFTGSDKVGWYLKSICGKKKVTLELGGNASVIIDESVENIEQVAKTVAIGCFLYAGQICISTQRVFVHEKVYDKFEALLIEASKNLGVGDPNKKGTSVGPVIDKGHLKRLADWVQEAKDGGAKVLLGGDVDSEDHAIYAPTLLTNTNRNMKVESEEAFGPLAIIEKVEDFDQAIARNNDSKFGLQAGVYTNSLENFKKAHEELEVGGVIINNIPGFRIDSMPYGGIKDSGLGREGIKYAMDEMTEPRLIVY